MRYSIGLEKTLTLRQILKMANSNATKENVTVSQTFKEFVCEMVLFQKMKNHYKMGRNFLVDIFLQIIENLSFRRLLVRYSLGTV